MPLAPMRIRIRVLYVFDDFASIEIIKKFCSCAGHGDRWTLRPCMQDTMLCDHSGGLAFGSTLRPSYRRLVLQC